MASRQLAVTVGALLRPTALAAGEVQRHNRVMQTSNAAAAITRLFSELIDGPDVESAGPGAFVLNTGDVGLLRSIDKLSAADASRSMNGGATIAAHGQHLRYGLSLMNRWAAEGGNPFADATWDEAWKTAAVNDAEWEAIRNGLGHESRRWLRALGSPRTVDEIEFTGIVASIAHLAYHIGAIRQINKDARGPREGTF
jgi:hypothetical protein